MSKVTAHPLFQVPITDNYLTLYFIPSPYGVDWSSPRTVLWSNIKNQFSVMPRKLGHVNVQLNCGSEEHLTGMTSASMNSKTQILINGAGYGILWHSFPGALEEKEKLQAELPVYIAENRISFLRLKISNSICQKLSNYLTEYRSLNVQKFYGLFNRPRHQEGAGCSAFGASFLEVANLMQSETKDWQVELMIPENLLGTPVSEKFVPIWRIAGSKSWANSNEAHKSILFWDPDKMHSWVLKTRKTPTQKFQNIEIEGAPGLYADFSAVEADTSKIWLNNK